MQKTFIQFFFRGDSGERKYEKRKKVVARNEKKETHLFGRSKNEKKIFDNYKRGKKIR